MTANRPKSAVILVVDDNPQNLQVASSMLAECGWQVRVAIDGQAALKSVEMQAPDLILLDIHMPKLNGYDVCKALKADSKTSDIPVIFATAVSEGFNKLTCFQTGAVDYITKPLQLEELRGRIGVHIEILELKKQVNELSKELNLEAPYPEVKSYPEE